MAEASERRLFSKCPAGGQEQKNFPSSRTKKSGVGVRAYSPKGALEEDTEGGRGNPVTWRAVQAWGKQQWEMLCWCRSWVELGCGNNQVRKKVSEQRGKLQHTHMHTHSVLWESCREKLLPPCRTWTPSPPGMGHQKQEIMWVGAYCFM